MDTWGSNTDAEEVAKALAGQIKDKVVLTTGVSPNGLGAKFVEAIAPYQPKLLILAGRDDAKVSKTEEAVKALAPGVPTRRLVLDIASLAKVRAAAKEVNSYSENIDVLVNNASIMAAPYSKTEDGFESQFGTNHLGPFLFTNLILPKILASDSKRIVNVASNGHQFSPIRFDDLGFKDGKAYNKWIAYGQAKTANMLFSVALAQKLNSKGLTSVSLHPGVIQTELGRHVNEADFGEMFALTKELGLPFPEEFSFKSLSQGSSTHVVAAFEPSLKEHNGSYLQDCGIAPSNETAAVSTDKENAQKLWTLSEKLVGETFNP